mgnify:CR=1 FL=1
MYRTQVTDFELKRYLFRHLYRHPQVMATTEIGRTIVRELFAAYPGQKAEEKKARQEMVRMALGTRSWTALEAMESEKLKDGLEQIRKALRAMANKPAEEAAS